MEQEELRALVSKGRAAAYKQTHARILLLSDENQSGEPMMDQEISRALKVGTATVERVRRRCVEEGVDAALGRREATAPPSEEARGQGEAHLIAMAISQPPEGRVSWTMSGRRIGGAGSRICDYPCRLSESRIDLAGNIAFETTNDLGLTHPHGPAHPLSAPPHTALASALALGGPYDALTRLPWSGCRVEV